MLSAADSGCAQSNASKIPAISDPLYARPVQLVDIGHGQRLNLHCTGEGGPTVLLDAGLGDSTISWALVQPALSTGTRVCSYDRAGLGFSDAARRPSTPINQIEDLHSLLVAARIGPPYVLVGHSLGGMNVRVFADKFPGEVKGIVIVEGSHEDQSAQGWSIGEPGQKQKWDATLTDMHHCIDDARSGLVPGTPAFQKCVGDATDPHFSAEIQDAQQRYMVSERWQAAAASERENVFYASADQTRMTRKDFGSLPIVVLTHSPYPKRDDETQEERNRRTLSWESLHTRVAAMSTRGINAIVPNSGHYIQYDQPQVVIDAVTQVVWMSRRPIEIVKP